ncbi:MAG: family 10 glycosylhydrolase [Bacteroidota bacterium]|nr:family 10 glycosylhydrolase [Bacteroidota bacterium]
MNIYFYLKILLGLTFFIVNLPAQPAGSTRMPKQEFRAVWLTTVAGLDWPKTNDIEEQKRSLLEIIQIIKAANYNTIFFQVRGRGDAMYKSNYEPWSDRLTGTFGRDPGWDPLEFVLKNAHSLGMEVHAWFNTFRVRNGEKVSNGGKRHIADIQPSWVRKLDGEMWLDPGIPEVRNYLINVAMDLVRNYSIDGIHFDFIRYPGSNYPDEDTYRKFGRGEDKDSWRRENVNKFVRAFYDSAMQIKPMLKVGSAPIGVYKNLPNAKGWQSYSAIYQDSRKWLQEKKHDYIAPQVYWSLGTEPRDPDFAALTKDWCENKLDRHIYIGIGAYKEKVFDQLPLLVDVSRLYGADGNSLFRYEFIKDISTISGRYSYPALIPPMSWKDNIPPNPPSDLIIDEISGGVFRLRWKPPAPAKDLDRAKYYVIYRSTRHPVNINEPSNIIVITTTNDTVFIDRIPKPKSSNYYYIVTAVDKGNNESQPATELKVEIPIVATLSKKLAPKFPLSSYQNNLESIFVTYEVAEEGRVKLKILDTYKKDLQIIVDENKRPGRYVVEVNSKFNESLITLQLTLGTKIYSKNLLLQQ